MIYKKKLMLLSSLVVILALVYTLTLIFDPQRQQSKAFAWLDPKNLSLVDGIEINAQSNKIILNRKNNIWVFGAAQEEYPVKQTRVEDLLQALSRKGVYPLRAASGEAREKLGLVEGSASRIIVKGGKGLPLLDILIGKADALGSELYLGRSGEKEVYSGEDRFTLYTDANPKSWYELRLFPPPEGRSGNVSGPRTEGSSIDVTSVQQADIVLPASGALPYAFRRNGGAWIMPGNESAALDNSKVDAWLRSVLESEGVDFSKEAPAGIEGSITLMLGDGKSRVIQVGPKDEEKRRPVTVSGSPLVYVLSEWTLNRLFREKDYFLK